MSVNIYGYCDSVTLQLKSRIYKPRERLKEEEYKSKPEIAVEMIKELKESEFKIKEVVSDSLYGESQSAFIRTIEELEIEYACFQASLCWRVKREKEVGRKNHEKTTL